MTKIKTRNEAAKFLDDAVEATCAVPPQFIAEKVENWLKKAESFARGEGGERPRAFGFRVTAEQEEEIFSCLG